MFIFSEYNTLQTKQIYKTKIKQKTKRFYYFCVAGYQMIHIPVPVCGPVVRDLWQRLLQYVQDEVIITAKVQTKTKMECSNSMYECDRELSSHKEYATLENPKCSSANSTDSITSRLIFNSGHPGVYFLLLQQAECLCKRIMDKSLRISKKH